MYIPKENTLKQRIEIVKLVDQYHSVLLDGKIFIRDSSLPLEDTLSICFQEIGKLENISITTKCYDYYDYVDYEKYLDSKC